MCHLVGAIILLVKEADRSVTIPAPKYKFKNKGKREFLNSIKISDAAA